MDTNVSLHIRLAQTLPYSLRCLKAKWIKFPHNLGG